MKRFTPTEDKYIRDNYLDKCLRQLSNDLNRSLDSVYGRMRYLGIKVPPEITYQRILNANRENLAGRFKPGHVPANKGKKMPQHVYEKAAPTMFKKGNLPHNTRSNGEISIRRDKTGRNYKYIRVSLSKWVLLHRVIWEQHNGKIPTGGVVKFKDGNSLNCDISNLYITDRCGHMHDNSIQRYPADVKTAIRAVAKIDRLINKQKQNNDETN